MLMLRTRLRNLPRLLVLRKRLLEELDDAALSGDGGSGDEPVGEAFPAIDSVIDGRWQ